jgi:caffeoyl-CoA O-methyltransferase
MNFSDIRSEDYCIRMSSDIPEYLIELEKETHLVTTMPQMISGRLQGRFLSFISRMVNPQNILELGTFTGYSALCLAEGLKENGQITTVEIDREFQVLIEKYFKKSPFYDRISIVFGDAKNFISDLSAKFDLIYIDAYKQDYIFYYEHSVRLLRKGGVIITDNVLWSGKVIFELEDKTAGAINDFNWHVKNDSRTEKIMIPFRDGISLIMKK